MYCRKVVFLQIFIVLLAIFLSVHALMVFYTNKTVIVHNTVNSTKSETTYNDWKEIAANPWLFPHHPSKVFFPSLCNDLDRLLRWMSNKMNKVTLLRFSYPWQIMLQNQIYTLVKFGQVHNYIVMVGDEKSLQVCFELNLPCYNGTKYYKNYYKDIDPTVDALVTDKKHYKPMNWFKLRFYLDVLTRNYTILALDADIAFSRKNIWLSLEKYAQDVDNCDMVFMEEDPINAGFFYSRSTADTIALFNKWVNTEYTHWDLDEQQSFASLRGQYYEICNSKDACNAVKLRKMTIMKNNSTKSIDTNIVSIRTFPSAYSVVGAGFCSIMKKLDPCHSMTAFVHPICIIGQNVKTETLKVNGFWLLKEPCEKNSIYFLTQNNSMNVMDVYRCKPLLSQDPESEREFEKCNNELAWIS